MFDFLGDIDWGGVVDTGFDWLTGGWGDDGSSGAGSLPWESIIGGGIGAWEAAQGSGGVNPYFLPGQERLLGTAFNAATDLYNQGPEQYYPNSTVAARNELVTAGEDMRLGTVGALENLANRSGWAAGGLQAGGAPRLDDYALPDQIGFGLPAEYSQAIMNPVFDQLTEQIIPGIHTSATAQGAFGGSRMQQQKADAVEQATEAATDALIRGNLQARQQSIGQRAGDISANLSQRGQNIEQNRLYNNTVLNGINAATVAGNQLQAPGNLMTDIGNSRTAYDQLLLNDDVNRWNFNQSAPAQSIGNLFSWNAGVPATLNEQGQAGTAGGDWLDILKGAIVGSNTGGGYAPGENQGPSTQANPGGGFAPVPGGGGSTPTYTGQGVPQY